MAYILEEKNDEEILDIAIYVILSSYSNSFYVSKSKFKSLEETYRTHYYLKNMKTKDLFKESRGTDKLPKMFLLERITASEREAFLHCVAWARYFQDFDFRSLADEKFNKYTVDLKNEALVIYNQIKDRPFAEICPAGKELFSTVGKIYKKTNTKREDYISFRIAPKDYKHIEKEAENVGLSITDYCKQMVLSECIIHIDDDFYKEISESTNKFYERDRILKQILFEINRTGKYYTADLNLIQSAIEENRNQQDVLIEQFNNFLKALRK